MNQENKPKEFWVGPVIDYDNCGGAGIGHYSCSDAKMENAVHVIEYLAYQEAQEKIAELEKNLSQLRETPGGKRIYGAINKIAELSEELLRVTDERKEKK